jgi:ATP-dependent Clp protease protease subunit
VDADLAGALFDRRLLLVSGVVTPERASEVAASLMTLDAIGDEPVELRLNAGSDSLDAAFCLIDTVDVLAVDVNATVAGAVTGTMVGVLAVCRHRRVGPLATVQLREPSAALSGRAADLDREAGDLVGRVERFVRRLAEATGRPFEHIEADLRIGRNLDAAQAVAYGLADEIVGSPPGPLRGR